MGGAVHGSKDVNASEEEEASAPKAAKFSRIVSLAKPRAVKKLVKPTVAQPLTMLGFNTSAPREKLTVVVNESPKAQDLGSA